VGSGNTLTNGPTRYNNENGRIYHYAPPGVIHHYRAEEQVVLLESSNCAADSPLAQRFKWVPDSPVQVGFGLVIVDDFLINRLKDRVLPLDQALDNEMELVPSMGHERANDFAHNWKQYGALLIKGALATEEEMDRAKNYRRTYAEKRLTEVIDAQTRRRQGSKEGIKVGFDLSDRAWAAEFGVALIGTTELLPRLAQEKAETSEDNSRVPCPRCAELIRPQARVCHYCGAKFAKPVLELLTAPAGMEATQ